MTNLEASFPIEYETKEDLCDFCLEEEKKVPAIVFCLDCSEHPKLCQECNEQEHRRQIKKKHFRKPISEYFPIKCDLHKKFLSLYCETCEKLVCVSCGFSKEHSSHQVLPIEQTKKTKEFLNLGLVTFQKEKKQIQKDIENEKKAVNKLTEKLEIKVAQNQKLLVSQIKKMCKKLNKQIQREQKKELDRFKMLEEQQVKRLKSIKRLNSVKRSYEKSMKGKKENRFNKFQIIEALTLRSSLVERTKTIETRSNVFVKAKQRSYNFNKSLLDSALGLLEQYFTFTTPDFSQSHVVLDHTHPKIGTQVQIEVTLLDQFSNPLSNYSTCIEAVITNNSNNEHHEIKGFEETASTAGKYTSMFKPTVIGDHSLKVLFSGQQLGMELPFAVLKVGSGCWDKNFKGSDCYLSNHNRTAEVRTKGRQCGNLEYTVWGEESLSKKSGVREFSIRLDSKPNNAYTIFLGLGRKKKTINYFSLDDAWLYEVSHSKIFSKDITPKAFGHKTKQGDIITIVADMINHTMSLRVGKENWGVAFDNIPHEGISVCAHFCLHNQKVTLI
ncbi:hypothetical protein M0812_16407 [Anaeramoeba flamelloides]|uniref:B box-type domain-containing protein n=1 Tax=Anaeramoeba flamelloides TaxID=1746091 RepID=A0AAV7ZKH6_9EUKA|nr:hypothetical protein M0812_16407 [Anaeramoeba flamelloides]